MNIMKIDQIIKGEYYCLQCEETHSLGYKKHYPYIGDFPVKLRDELFKRNGISEFDSVNTFTPIRIHGFKLSFQEKQRWEDYQKKHGFKTLSAMIKENINRIVDNDGIEQQQTERPEFSDLMHMKSLTESIEQIKRQLAEETRQIVISDDDEATFLKKGKQIEAMLKIHPEGLNINQIGAMMGMKSVDLQVLLDMLEHRNQICFDIDTLNYHLGANK